MLFITEPLVTYIIKNSDSLISLVFIKPHVYYQLEGAGYDWVRILLGLNSGAVSVVYLTMLIL